MRHDGRLVRGRARPQRRRRLTDLRAENDDNMHETARAEWICRLICSKGLGDTRTSWYDPRP